MTTLSNNIAKFNLLISKEIPNYNGKTLSKICSYQITDKYITLTASNKDDSIFAFGHTPPYATFYNSTLIDQQPDSSILFFQNINQAFAYENILSKNNLTIPNSVITGHNSNDLGILDWSLLTERKLLFICETKKKAYEELNLYKKYFEKYNINFKIFPYPLLFRELGFSFLATIDFNKLSHIESELLKNALHMDENVNNNFQTLWNKSLSFKNFVHWGTELGLLSKYQTEENYFEYSPLPSIENEEFDNNIHNIQLNKLILNNSITLLHAPAETGKSLFALSLAKALLTSKQFLFFKTSQSQPKIFILDGETPPPTLSKRIKQLEINKQDKNIIFISKLQEQAEKSKTFWSNLDLSKEDCRNQLTTFITSNNINFTIIDNISCLVPHTLRTEKLPQEIFNWLQSLSAKCSVLLIHHTKHDGSKIIGSQLWTDRPPNEIQLININSYKRPPATYKKLINDYKPATGLFCGIQFNKTKSFPILQNQIFWVTLPINASEWKLLVVTDKNGNILEDITPSYNFPDLNERENFILSKTNEKFTAKEVDLLLKKKRGTVAKCLMNLKAKGYIKAEGKFRSTCYIKTDKTDLSQAEQTDRPEINNTELTEINEVITAPKTKTSQEPKITYQEPAQLNNSNDKIEQRQTKSGIIIRHRETDE